MKSNYINIKNLYKRFKNIVACDNINFDIGQGEIIAILGESGSGKSTLLKILAGFEEFDSGEFSIDGNIIFSKDKFVKIEQRNIGLLFQEYSLFPNLTISENIKIAKSNLSSSDNELINRELSNFLSRYPYQLSGGQQQRVALIRTILLYPKLILLDEPFSNLDENSKSLLRAEFRKLIKEREVSTLLVTHDINDAIEFADRIIVLQDGKIVANDTYSSIISNSNNIYIASLFKHINILNSEDLGIGVGKKIGLKPEDIEISDEGIEAELIYSIPFYGQYKVSLKLNNSILFCFSKENLKQGNKIKIKYQEDKIINFA